MQVFVKNSVLNQWASQLPALEIDFINPTLLSFTTQIFEPGLS